VQPTIRRKVESGVTALIILALGGFAFAHQGVPAEEVDLNDGGVWVTNAALGMTGHLNYQSRIIDGGLNAPTRDFDISQEGNRVLLQDKADKAARPIDTATLTMGTRVTTGNLEYSHGSNTVLIADTGEGKVWATSLERFTDFSSSAAPLLEEVDSPHVVVGRDGTGFVVDASGTITKVTGSDERFRTESVGTLPDGITSSTQLTIAGDQLVAIDEGRIRTAGSSTEVPGITAKALAQQPSLERGHVSVATPDALLTIPLYLVLDAVHLTNTVWSIILPCSVSPFGVFLGRVYADSSVPNEIIDSARIDGASEIRIFFTIVLRLLAPAMVTIFLFIFVATWNNFFLPLMTINSAELKPVTLGLYGMSTYFNPQYGALLQGALLGVIPLIGLFLGLQRFWQSGLAAGAVKG